MRTVKIGLADALFSKVLQRILALLYGRPDDSFHTNEIIRLTHSGTGAVQRDLEKLASVGFITIKQIGNQKHYQANRKSLLYSELHAIVIKTFGLADVLCSALEPMTSNIHIAFIYGSIAKQEDTVNSDIDVMLLSDSLTYADLYPLLEKTETQFGRSINPTIYTPLEWTRKLKEGNNFIRKILEQPKIFLIGTEDDLTKFG